VRFADLETVNVKATDPLRSLAAKFPEFLFCLKVEADACSETAVPI
jgi:hypothetical protein